MCVCVCVCMHSTLRDQYTDQLLHTHKYIGGPP